jgi:hypothetical protein
MQEVPRYALFGDVQVEILKTGHFPHSVIVLEVQSKKQYEVDLSKLTFY